MPEQEIIKSRLKLNWHIEVNTGGGDDGLTMEDRRTLMHIIDKLLANGRQLKLVYTERKAKPAIPQ